MGYGSAQRFMTGGSNSEESGCAPRSNGLHAPAYQEYRCAMRLLFPDDSDEEETFAQVGTRTTPSF